MVWPTWNSYFPIFFIICQIICQLTFLFTYFACFFVPILHPRAQTKSRIYILPIIEQCFLVSFLYFLNDDFSEYEILSNLPKKLISMRYTRHKMQYIQICYLIKKDSNAEHILFISYTQISFSLNLTSNLILWFSYNIIFRPVSSKNW